MKERCLCKHCRNPPFLTYYNYPVCYKHWTHHCDESRAFYLKRHLDIRRESRENQTHTDQ